MVPALVLGAIKIMTSELQEVSANKLVVNKFQLSVELLRL